MNSYTHTFKPPPMHQLVVSLLLSSCMGLPENLESSCKLSYILDFSYVSLKNRLLEKTPEPFKV